MADEVAGLVVKLAMEDGSFQESISTINRQMKVVDSEFKSATGGAKDFGNSIDGLKANIDRLSQTTKLQTQLVEKYQKRLDKSKEILDVTVKAQDELGKKIDEAKKAYDNASSSLGKNSSEAKALKEELDKLQKKYSENEQKIRSNVKQIDNHTIALNNSTSKLKQMERQLYEAQDAVEDFGREIEQSTQGQIGGIDILNVALGNLISEGVEGLADGLNELIQYAFEWTQEIDKMAAQTGFARDEVQKWDVILKSTGASIDTLQGALADFQERIFDASSGAGEAAEVFADLGVEVKNTDGSLRSSQDVFNESILALQNMTDATKKSAYSTILLSTAGEDLSQVLNMTNEQLMRTKANVNIVSDADIDSINELKGSLVEFMDAVGKPLIGILGDIAAILAPIVDLVSWLIGPIVSLVEDFTSVIGDTFRTTSELEEEYMRQNAGNVEAVYLNAEDTISGSLDAIQDDTEKTFGYLDKAVDNYVNNELREYEKKLRETFDNGTLQDEMSIQRRLAKKKESLEEEADKTVNTHKNMYSDTENAYKQHLQRMNTIYDSTASKGVKGSSINRNIPSYNVGTKYHPGGLAYVHKDELIELPRGSQVHTVNETKTIAHQNNNTTNAQSTVNINGPITIKSNNAQDIIKQLEEYSRLI